MKEEIERDMPETDYESLENRLAHEEAIRQLDAENMISGRTREAKIVADTHKTIIEVMLGKDYNKYFQN